MKRAGDVLSALFDERLINKAKGYSRLFDSWKDVTQKNGIAAAADHSRIKELDRGILLIETDHPGWKQILQTKQSKLLNDYRRRFPELDISGISLVLQRSFPRTLSSSMPQPESGTENETKEEPAAQTVNAEASAAPGYSAIKDEAFKETLKRLEQSIIQREGEKPINISALAE